MVKKKFVTKFAKLGLLAASLLIPNHDSFSQSISPSLPSSPSYPSYSSPSLFPSPPLLAYNKPVDNNIIPRDIIQDDDIPKVKEKDYNRPVEMGLGFPDSSHSFNYKIEQEKVDLESYKTRFFDLLTRRTENRLNSVNMVYDNLYYFSYPGAKLHPSEFYANRIKSAIQSSFEDIAKKYAEENYLYEGSWIRNIADKFIYFAESGRFSSPLNPDEGLAGTMYQEPDKEKEQKINRWEFKFKLQESDSVSAIYHPYSSEPDKLKMNFRLGLKGAEIITTHIAPGGFYFYGGIRQKVARYDLSQLIEESKLDMEFDDRFTVYAGVSRDIRKTESSGLKTRIGALNLGITYDFYWKDSERNTPTGVFFFTRSY